MQAWLLFVVVGSVLVGSAVAVVATRDLVRAVLWLALGLITTAVAYMALSADFIAAAQVLLYTGGIVTLMLFAVMLTRRLDGAKVAVAAGLGGTRGPIAGIALFGLLAVAILEGSPARGERLMVADSAGLGVAFLTRHVLAFELLSVLLLAAMIGAIALARKDTQTPLPRTTRPPLPQDDA